MKSLNENLISSSHLTEIRCSV